MMNYNSTELVLFNFKSGYDLTIKGCSTDEEINLVVISRDNNKGVNYFMNIPTGKNMVDIVTEIVYKHLTMNYDIKIISGWFRDWILNNALTNDNTTIRDCIIKGISKYERNV